MLLVCTVEGFQSPAAGPVEIENNKENVFLVLHVPTPYIYFYRPPFLKRYTMACTVHEEEVSFCSHRNQWLYLGVS